jgi:hypothetical protein
MRRRGLDACGVDLASVALRSAEEKVREARTHRAVPNPGRPAAGRSWGERHVVVRWIGSATTVAIRVVPCR